MDAIALHAPKSPKGSPVIGDALRYLRNPLLYLLTCRQEHGNLVRLPLPKIHPYLVSDPALIEHVLITDNKSYIKDFFLRRLGLDVLGQGLLTSEGEFWRRQRRLAQPAFHRERIAEYADIMLCCTEEYLQTLRAGQTRDLHEDMMGLTLQIVCKTLFSTDILDMSAEVGQALSVIMDRYGNDTLLLLFPFLSRWPLARNRRFARAIAKLDSLVLRMIKSRRAASTQRNDLLSLLLSAKDEDDGVMTDAQLRDEVITLFSAGHETTALVLSYAFLLLSRHPGAAERLYAELSAVLPGRSPSLSDLPALPYTEAVVLETLRLYPPAWAIGREALLDTELSGYKISRGAQIWIIPWVLHRDPQYFPEPETFLPERWLDGLQKRLPRFAFMPFGGGPRLCIGNAFAMTEAVLLLAAIARRFRMQVVEEQPLRLMASVTLRPRHSLYAQVFDRGEKAQNFGVVSA
jgi:cytochrome P450